MRTRIWRDGATRQAAYRARKRAAEASTRLNQAMELLPELTYRSTMVEIALRDTLSELRDQGSESQRTSRRDIAHMPLHEMIREASNICTDLQQTLRVTEFARAEIESAHKLLDEIKNTNTR